MKPFDLTRALAGDPVVTRNGSPVRIAGYNPEAYPNQRILGWIEQVPQHWHDDGSSSVNPAFNLYMATKMVTRIGWINVYTDQRDDGIHPTKQLADFMSSKRCIACVRVTYEFEE